MRRCVERNVRKTEVRRTGHDEPVPFVRERRALDRFIGDGEARLVAPDGIGRVEVGMRRIGRVVADEQVRAASRVADPEEPAVEIGGGTEARVASARLECDRSAERISQNARPLEREPIREPPRRIAGIQALQFVEHA